MAKLESNYYILLKLKRYNLNRPDSLVPADFLFFPTEQYENIRKIFAKYNIGTEKEAEEKMSKWRAQYPLSQFQPIVYGSKKSPNTRDTIVRFYELISSFYTGFFKSKLYWEASVFQI